MKQEYKIPENLQGSGMRFAIVGGEWYQEAVDNMINASVEVLLNAGVAKDDIEIYRAPGSLEIPVLCKHICDQKKVNAILTFGVIIRGETAHFDQMMNSIPFGLTQLAISTGIPIMNEIIATDKEEHVTARTQGKSNKGYEAAIAALKIAQSIRQLK